MFANGARWYGETPEGRREQMERDRIARMHGEIIGNVGDIVPKMKSSDDWYESSFSKPKESSFSSTNYAQQQNQWLATTLLCM